MNTVQKLTKGIQALNPYIAAAGSGAAIGASVSDDRKKGALKGALVGLGGIASGKLINTSVEAVLKKAFGSKLADAEAFYDLLKRRASKSEIIDFLISKKIPPDQWDALRSIGKKANIARTLSGNLAPGIGLAGAAYALKNDPNNKKR